MCFLLVGVISCAKNEEEPEQIEKEPEQEYIALFEKGQEGYSCYRIPAIIRSKSGTLLAFAEGRKYGCADEGDIDLVVKRSTDNGKSWSNLSIVWDDGSNTCGNPAPVVDEVTGKIILLMTWNNGEDHIGEINDGSSKDTRRVFVTTSDDDGVSWTEPYEITSAVKESTWGWYATGPCHGIQIKKGNYAGRLVIPCDNISLKSEGGKGHSHVIYSDDGGESWQLGNNVPENEYNPNESTVAELSNGDLMLNMRCGNSNNFRLVSTSSDGGVTWTEPMPDFELLDPVCQGSLLAMERNGQHTLFFSNAASTKRENMTIKMSTNDGEVWSRSYAVHSGPSAYSDIVNVSEDEIAILFEHGISARYERIVYQLISIEDFRF
ncbi:sialidase family protein [Mariniphaga anaerophila]|uniref:sialidase family protein n=1 Tax=Mariniphaga anaerophila TaxID=1484053 RepID=UPI0015879E77|nr:sialidase family protein [Mariniphaga anaerophila]